MGGGKIGRTMADGQQSGEEKRFSLRDQSRQWFLTVGTVLALLTTIIGFLSDSVGVWQFLQENGIVAEATPSVDPKTAFGPIATETPLATPTVTPAPTATAVMTPTATPFVIKAAEGERLLIVAQFSNFATDANYNVAGRINEALAAQVAAAHLEDTRIVVWPDPIVDNDGAAQVLAQTRAALVIWGEYDSGRVRVRFSLAGGGEELDWQRLLGAPTELSTTINLDVPRETQALALMALGRLYRNAGDMTRARAVFAQALAQQPSDKDTVATLSFYLAALDAAAMPPALDRAIEGYSHVIEMRPDWVNARYNRGLAYLTRYWTTAEVANLDGAIEDFTWTLGVKDDYTEAYINRAIAYYTRDGEGDMEASLNDLDKAIQVSPTSYRAYYNRGLAYIHLNDQAHWVADLEKSLQLEPSFWVSHHALCWGYALAMMPDEALPHCEEAVRNDPSGSTRDAHGLAMTEAGRLDEAITDLEQYMAWLDTQPEAVSTLNKRPVYENILEGLHAGENRVTPEVLAELR
jgi:tetratricopeptide (TPR) repeat protein